MGWVWLFFFLFLFLFLEIIKLLPYFFPKHLASSFVIHPFFLMGLWTGREECWDWLRGVWGLLLFGVLVEFDYLFF